MTTQVKSKIPVKNKKPMEGEAEPITLKRDQNLDLRFSGVLLAQVSSHTPQAERWTELNLYKTDKEKFVLQSIGRTVHQDRESDRYAASIANSTDELIEALTRFTDGKLGWLAKKLLDAANIAYVEDI